MINHLSKLLAILATAAFLTACKLSVISTPFGDIVASNTTYNCAGGNVCDVELTAGTNLSFTATAHPGFQFVKWQAGSGNGNGGFQCANSTNPVCAVSIPNNATGVAIAALSDIGYLMPLYKEL